MNKTFEQEWNLYKAGGKRPSFAGEAPRGDAEFDSPVNVGEIRIFADMARPFVALVAEDRGNAGFFIIPVSPFTVPASSREALEGDRVYQLWNACTASRGFVERSWLVDTIDGEELAALVGTPRRDATTSLSADGVVAEYEREFLVSGGDFIPLVNKEIPRIVHVSWRRVLGVAACFVVLLGLGIVVLNEKEEDKWIISAPCLVPENVAPAEAEEPAIDLMAEIVATEKLRRTAEDVLVETAMSAPAPEKERQCKREAAAVVSSPVKMKSMCCSRATGSIGAMAVGGEMGYTSSAMERRLRLASNTPWHDHAGGKMASISIKDQFLEVERQPAGTERYAEIQENEYRDPTSEPLSTFGLDVDTSSYTTMRRYLTEWKRQPPKGSVRLEEFVNYFKYRYPQPNGDDPIAIACEMGVCPWAPTHKLLRVGVQAREVPKSGLKMLVGKLRPEDRVAIVTYADGTTVQLASTPGSEKDKIHAVVDGLRCGGCTYGAGGIQLAYEEAKKNFDKNANNRVILITDGDFNVGISDQCGNLRPEVARGVHRHEARERNFPHGAWRRTRQLPGREHEEAFDCGQRKLRVSRFGLRGEESDDERVWRNALHRREGR